ncbi:helix-turn-helix domain-containing protein [Dactylosporangium sp. NPDC051541]|uniref:helix-turn-helix domain-containing protein n=1 Tax=Dactylosporangium sp. NPDC051541 TaxID=3363977 RepID=UPI0037AC6BB3
MGTGFTIGDGYAMYRGPVRDSAPHRHAAFQIAIAARGDVAVSGDGAEHRGAAIVVAPMVAHRLLAAADVLTFFVEPHSVFADRLRRQYPRGIVLAPELRHLGEHDVGPPSLRPSGVLDPRLTRALHTLLERELSMPELAASVGLSAPRLRALAREQVGMPLPRWRVWVRLRRAAEALRAGQAPAAAAVAAGFADQAHLTRDMRDMMGLTPAVVLPVLRGQRLAT